MNDDTAPAADGCDTPDFQTEDIEDAVDSGLVADGDTLVICEGTYNPPDAIAVTKGLTIEGRAGANRDDITIAVGGTATVKVKPIVAGAYTIDCDIPGHKESGMLATLTVNP